jgi:Heparinase II/III-like protein/Heparinase II/III N-terminus
VDWGNVTPLLRYLGSLPPDRLLVKAARFARRRVVRAGQRWADRRNGSYLGEIQGLRWQSRVSISAAEIPSKLCEPLRLLADCYCRHQFDLLGSGSAVVRYDAACRGFEGHSFAAHVAVSADRDGAWLADHVNASNLATARALWGRIDDPDYSPIDWQLDFRSGYRWNSQVHFTRLAIPVDLGADVKVPWELGRLQHLPQLALCAVLAQAEVAEFASPAIYLRELRCQLLDFLALNPPRFGVNWMCPMDVGIRAANIVLAMDLVVGAKLDADGAVFDQVFFDVVLRSVREHAIHVVDHLEWYDSGRSNHYLANLVGLLWAASHLPSDRLSDSMVAFAAAEVLHEGDHQFGADGGNYEGSTNYHRLSAELLLFGVALLNGLSASDLARLDSARDALKVRAPWPAGPLQRYALPGGGVTIVPPALREKLFRAAALIRAATRPDGRAAQIGDTDSGRLFKLAPAGRIEGCPDAREFVEDACDHRATAAGIESLFGLAEGASSLDSIVVARLTGVHRFPPPGVLDIEDHGDLDAVVAAIMALPAQSRRHCRLSFGGRICVESWRRSAFPNFGHYGFTVGGAFIAFRCAPAPPASAPLGHTHDDNLSIEYVLGGARRIDPGSYCYTPSVTLRNRYRGADAHDVVRAEGWEVAAPGADLFALEHTAWARCLAWRPQGVAGEIAGPRGRLARAVVLTEDGVDIWDGVDPPNRLRPIAPQLPAAVGYGRLEPAGEQAS